MESVYALISVRIRAFSLAVVCTLTSKYRLGGETPRQTPSESKSDAAEFKTRDVTRLEMQALAHISVIC